MKLTKEIIRLFKYHGFVTVTVDDEVILNEYKTVEEFAEAGYVNDSQAIKMAKMIFSDNGDPAVGPATDDDVMKDEKTSEVIENAPTEVVEEPVVEEPVVEEPVVEEPVAEPVETVVEEPVAEPVETVVEEPVVEEPVETVVEEAPSEVIESEPVVEPEPVVEETPKPKKTTKKKSTEKES